jgi:ABC-type branched-subunit amino acid transport system substrate-binding protein
MAVLAAMLLLATACGGSGDEDDDASSSSSTTADTAGQEPAAAPGFDGTTIRLGAITPQTGVAALVGKPLTRGNQVFFERLNAAGGIAGKYKVELEVVDSQYQASVGLQQFNATKDDVVAYVQILGTAVVNAVLAHLDTEGVIAGPATLDSFWVPEQQLMALGAPYQVQAVNGMDWWINQEGHSDSTICLLRQGDPYGQAGKDGLDFAAAEMGFTVAEDVTFAPTDTDFSAQVNQLKAAGCTFVYLIGLPNATLGIVSAAEAVGFAPQWMGQAPTWIGVLAGNKYVQDHFVIVSEGPEWGDVTSPGMKQMLADVAAYAPDQGPDVYFSFGYAQAWSMAQILEKAVANGDLSRKGIVKAMNGVGTIKTGGILGDYVYGPPAKRKPPRAGTIFGVDPNTQGGLKALTEAFVSDAAKKYEFDF